MSETIEHEGIVRSVSGGRAVIAVRTGGCSGCGHRAGCGLGGLAGQGGGADITVAVDGSVHPGAQVILSLQPGPMVKAALLAYLLPAFTLVLGAAAGTGWGSSDGAVALGALIGLATGFLATRFATRWQPVPAVRAADKGF